MEVSEVSTEGEPAPPPAAPATAAAAATATESDAILLTVYYFGDEIGACEDYSTITTILPPTDHNITIHEVKKTVAHFLRQSKIDQEALKTGPVTIASTTISPLYSSDISSNGDTGDAGTAGSGGFLPEALSSRPSGMLAVIASEKHIVEIVSNIERMNVVVGKEPGALDTLENWCMQDSKCLTSEFFMAATSEEPPAPALGARKVWTGQRVDIILAAGNKMPVPPPMVAIVKTSKAWDLREKQFTSYHMSVKQAGLEWMIAHRYSDFAALRLELLEQDPTDVGFIPRVRVPELPRKELGPSNSVDDSVVKKRTVSLQTFVHALLADPAALSNIHVLSFFGILSTSRHTHSEKMGARNTIHLSKLKTDCRWGDLILFKCANSMSRLQRSVTGSEWDHVGIVVRGNSMSSNSLQLLESTGEGVTSYPLFSRLRAYHDTKFATYMCLRRLDVSRDIDLFQKLHRFAGKVVGKPYGFTFSKLIAARSIKAATVGARCSEVDSISITRAHSESDLRNTIASRDDKSPLSSLKPNTSYIERGTMSRRSENGGSYPEARDTSREVRMSSSTTRSSYCDLPDAQTTGRSDTPPRTSVSRKEKVKKFFKDHRIYKSGRKENSEDSTEYPTSGGEGEEVVATKRELSSFFCSELVAACLQTMDLLPTHINVSAIWPGSFSSDGDVDRMIHAGAKYGEEYIVDCRVMEISRAKARPSWSGNHAIIDADDF